MSQPNPRTHRIRRGQLVEIPEEWRGQVPHPQTIAKRKSKQGEGRRFSREVQR